MHSTLSPFGLVLFSAIRDAPNRVVRGLDGRGCRGGKGTTGPEKLGTIFSIFCSFSFGFGHGLLGYGYVEACAS
jgi:hypothetical protein